MRVLFLENYKGYAELYEKYNKDGLEILAFPCNQFGAQMGDTDVCSAKYKAKYPHMGEVNVWQILLEKRFRVF